MVADICNYIGMLENSYLFTGAQRYSSGVLDNIIILDNKKYLPRERNKNCIAEWQDGLIKRLGEYLDEIKPDYVFAHGIGEFVYNAILLCKSKNIPVTLVDHLYVGKKKSQYGLSASPWQNKILSIPNINVITVGKSMRKQIIDDHADINPDKIVPIVNGTKINPDDKAYIDKKDKKELICVGSIQPRKNQLQLIRAASLLASEVKENIIIKIIGHDVTNSSRELNELINSLGVSDIVEYIGGKNPEEMQLYYKQADCLIQPSLIEGVSLVALEMLRFGKPVIMFSDNETAEEIKDDKCGIFVQNHSDDALADAITKWFMSEWDYHYIEKFSNYFTMERVANDYIKYCKARLKLI